MAGIGPAPNPHARRRGAPGSVILPAAGRTGRAPAWPLMLDIEFEVKARHAKARLDAVLEELADVEAEGGKPSSGLQRKLEAAQVAAEIVEAKRDALSKLERQAWRTPQAVAWDRLRWTRDVAQYARHKAKGELGDLEHAKEARQWSDRLGLNSQALQRLRWVISDQPALKPVPSPPPGPPAPVRRLRVFGDDA